MFYFQFAFVSVIETDDILFCFQRPEKLNEKPSELPAIEVIAPGGSYNPDFFSHQVTRQTSSSAPVEGSYFNISVIGSI